MNLLLDTHIWLWSLQNPERLGKHTRQVMNDPENQVWISPINVWEALLLNEKGRVTLGGDLAVWLNRARAPFRETPLTSEIAAESRFLPLPHRDPADRFLAATAKVLNLTLVTADTNLLGLGDIATLANR